MGSQCDRFVISSCNVTTFITAYNLDDVGVEFADGGGDKGDEGDKVF